METVLNRAKALRQELTDFVLDAEDELAVALETFSAVQLARVVHHDMQRRALLVDRFIVEGKVGETTPIDLFLAEHLDLSESDRQLVLGWKRSFIGLFAVHNILADGLELTNWTTAKRYQIQLSEPTEETRRLGEGEILLAQIAPITATEWMFSSPYTSLGKLGKPKLAVAIGNFKQNYKPYLYSDAPELLEEAWKSVEQHHQNFVDFFGSEEVTMPGYQLNKKLAEFQAMTTQKSLEAAGIDPSASLEELAEQSGVSKEEMAEAARELGADEKSVSQLLDAPLSGSSPSKLVAPTIELPAPLKKAEQVTILTHPRWGQMFLPTYTQFKALLAAQTEPTPAHAKEVVQKHLKDPEFSSFVWHRLAEAHPEAMQALLQQGLQRPDFQLSQLDAVLKEFGKEIEPTLPEIASVPLHLHNLFQEALLEVNKSRPKAKKKMGAGFQR
ncbi:MAG TPA: hypothetical protein V6C84_29235 [Coleofasciculaceae cyanobacterium]